MMDIRGHNMAFKSMTAKLAALLLLSLGAVAHAGTPSDDVGSLRITIALGQGVDMLQVLKRIDAKDAKELKRDLESQGDTDDVTLEQIRLASDMPASLPSTTCDGRSSTRMSSSALTHDCAAMKCATSRRARVGRNSAHAAMPTPIAGMAH